MKTNFEKYAILFNGGTLEIIERHSPIWYDGESYIKFPSKEKASSIEESFKDCGKIMDIEEAVDYFKNPKYMLSPIIPGDEDELAIYKFLLKSIGKDENIPFDYYFNNAEEVLGE